MCDLEDAALARDDFQDLPAARVGDVFTEHDDARIVRHLVLECSIDRADHRLRCAFGPRRRVECGRCRINVRRIDPESGGVLRRLRRLQRGLGRIAQLAVDVGRNRR